MQSFLSTPSFPKSLIYKNPNNTYQRYCNAYTYAYLVRSGTPMLQNKENLLKECNLAWKEVKKKDAKYIDAEIKMFLNFIPSVTRSHWKYVNELSQASTSDKMTSIQPTLEPSSCILEPAANAISQKSAIRSVTESQKKRQQYIQMIEISDDADL